MAAVPIGAENAKPAAVIADNAGLNRRSAGTRLNAIARTQSAGDELGELFARGDGGQNVWWREGVEPVVVESDDPKPMSLEEIVSGFLSLVMKHPEKVPKLVRDQEANRFSVYGFNRAQETLREVLRAHGESEEIRSLAEVREDGQQQPIEAPGGRKLWIAG